MISVCIPIYNHCVVPLVADLHAQAAQLGDGVAEVVCIDDGSDSRFQQTNSPVADMATLVALDHNVGRARVRNMFLRHAKGEYLLFIDCDATVPAGFLQAYANMLPSSPQVVVGGHRYDRRADDAQHHLRYMYGTQAESQPASQRRKHPHRSFMSGNFMIGRDVFAQTHFDESIVRYGYEDTLLGYRLGEAGVEVQHIDNPIIIKQVEDNAEFLRKTAEAMHTLSALYTRLHDEAGFCDSVRLLHTYNRLLHMGMQDTAYAVYQLLRKPLESHFLAGNAISTTQFGFYKLGLFIENCKSINTQ